MSYPNDAPQRGKTYTDENGNRLPVKRFAKNVVSGATGAGARLARSTQAGTVIRVLSYSDRANGDNASVTLLSGNDVISAARDLAQRGGCEKSYNPHGYYETNVNSDLNAQITGGATFVASEGTYGEVPV
jgi:hypothetical protein